MIKSRFAMNALFYPVSILFVTVSYFNVGIQAQELTMRNILNVTCGCEECNEEMLNVQAREYTCWSRISYLINTQGYDEIDACRQVAGDEFPLICGPACDPDRCNGDMESNPIPGTSESEIASWLEHYEKAGWSIGQIRAAIIVPKFTGSVSILSSCYIINDVMSNPQKRNESVYHRLLLGLSVTDVIYTFAHFVLTSWTMPKGSQLYAIGTEVTCHITAFFRIMGAVMTPLYVVSLTTFYLIQFRLIWAPIKIKATEKWLHCLPWIVGITTASVGLGLNLYSPLAFSCW